MALPKRPDCAQAKAAHAPTLMLSVHTEVCSRQSLCNRSPLELESCGGHCRRERERCGADRVVSCNRCREEKVVSLLEKEAATM